jgi:hypothetical protein
MAFRLSTISSAIAGVWHIQRVCRGTVSISSILTGDCASRFVGIDELYGGVCLVRPCGYS